MAKNKTAVRPPPTSTIETFRDIRGWNMDGFRQDEPTCFNGQVSIRRYRITVEEIEEPQEVLVERLKNLWRENNNSHHWGPLQAAAQQLGFTLDHAEMGKDRKPRY